MGLSLMFLCFPQSYAFLRIFEITFAQVVREIGGALPEFANS